MNYLNHFVYRMYELNRNNVNYLSIDLYVNNKCIGRLSPPVEMLYTPLKPNEDYNCEMNGFRIDMPVIHYLDVQCIFGTIKFGIFENFKIFDRYYVVIYGIPFFIGYDVPVKTTEEITEEIKSYHARLME